MNNNESIIVMTMAHAKSEKQAVVVKALQDVAEAARAESGCIEYRVFRSMDDPTTSVNYERWSSNEAREAFLDGSAVAAFAAAVGGTFTSSPQPILYEEIG